MVQQAERMKYEIFKLHCYNGINIELHDYLNHVKAKEQHCE